jgi:hypothetical protein
MLQSPNYIHFRTQWQVLGLGAGAQWPGRETFLALMSRLNAPPMQAGFDDFLYRPDRCEMGRVRGDSPDGGRAFTKLTCTAGQITFVEEWTESTVEEYADAAVGILGLWFELFPRTAIVAQKCCLRALVQPSAATDSREFLGAMVMKVREPMQQVFEALPFRIGLTFTCVRNVQAVQLLIDATVNSWRDNQRVWVQVEGTYPMKQPVNAANLDAARFPLADAKALLETEVLGFLNQFDRPGT